MGVNGSDHVGVIEKGKRRRAKQAAKEKPKAQTYGGGPRTSQQLVERDKAEIREGQKQAVVGLDTMYRERDQYGQQAGQDREDIGRERSMYFDRNYATLDANETERQKQLGAEQAYGGRADAALGDYAAGRGAILGNAGRLESNPGLDQYYQGRGAVLGGASELEGYARGAAAEYQDAAALAQKAAAERNQRNALAIAAGRGPGATRTALATAAGANAQSALDQQVMMAQQNNQLNAMRNQAIAQAAGIRSGVGAQDQSAAQQQSANQAAAAGIRAGLGGQDQAAAQLLTQRQQYAGGLADQQMQRRAALEQANADYQLKASGQQQGISANDVNVGMGLGQAHSAIGADSRNAFLGAQQAQFASQLGADSATDAQRQEWAKNNSPHEKFKRGVGTATLGILGS